MKSGCPLCGKEAVEVDKHHVSYCPEVSVKLCDSCHRKVHETDGFAEPLEPDMNRPDSEDWCIRFHCPECGTHLSLWKRLGERCRCPDCESYYGEYECNRGEVHAFGDRDKIVTEIQEFLCENGVPP